MRCYLRSFWFNHLISITSKETCNTSALERIENACLDLRQMFYGLSVQSVTFVYNLFVYAGDVISFFVMEFTSKLTSEIINIFRRKLEN